MNITNGCLIITMHAELYDEVLDPLIEDILMKLSKFSLKAVILDMAMVRLVDSHIAATFSDLAHMTRLLGALTIMVGIRPSVANALADLNITMNGVITLTNREDAFKLVARNSDRN